MIINFKHKGLKAFFLNGDISKLNQDHVKKLRLVLAKLHTAEKIEDCNFPNSGLHKLEGQLNSFWSIKINGNWRIIFQFREGKVFDVDYLDYH